MANASEDGSGMVSSPPADLVSEPARVAGPSSAAADAVQAEPPESADLAEPAEPTPQMNTETEAQLRTTVAGDSFETPQLAEPEQSVAPAEFEEATPQLAPGTPPLSASSMKHDTTAPTEPAEDEETAPHQLPEAVLAAEPTVPSEEAEARNDGPAATATSATAAPAAPKEPAWAHRRATEPPNSQVMQCDRQERPRRASDMGMDPRLMQAQRRAASPVASAPAQPCLDPRSMPRRAASPPKPAPVARKSDAFRNLNEFWSKKSKGFAGDSMDKSSRLSRTEAQAALQRLMNAGQAVDFDEVRRLRKLVDTLPQEAA